MPSQASRRVQGPVHPVHERPAAQIEPTARKKQHEAQIGPIRLADAVTDAPRQPQAEIVRAPAKLGHGTLGVLQPF